MYNITYNDEEMSIIQKALNCYRVQLEVMAKETLDVNRIKQGLLDESNKAEQIMIKNYIIVGNFKKRK